MKNHSLFVLILFTLQLIHPASHALPVTPGGPQIAARAYIMEEFDSERVLLEHNADERTDPASLTKLMTAYVVFHELQSKHISLSDKTRISEKAWRMGGSRMYLEVDTEVSVQELLKGMIIQSGNDAGVALAEFTAGSEESFASLMNQYAAKLGMKNTRFANSTGMPAENHYTTARDMVIMTRAIIREFPEYYKYYSEKEYTYNDITQQNRNTLLWRNKHVDGVKTGYTESAGYCLVTSAKQDNMRLITVLMGADSKKSRGTETQKMLTYGFRFFETHILYQAGAVLDTQRIWQGESQELQLGLSDTLYVTIPRGQYKNLSAKLNINQEITAPISKGMPLGTVKVDINGTVMAEAPIIALHNVAEGNFFQRILDYVLMQF